MLGYACLMKGNIRTVRVEQAIIIVPTMLDVNTSSLEM